MRTIYEAKLLLIDDNPDLIQLLCEQLNHAGYTWIQTASNCEDARTAFSKQRPDCMILDINLPDGDGFSLFRELRAQADIPTLFLSARDADADRLFGLGLGADDYFSKPFGGMVLISRVKALLRRAKGTETESQIAYHEILLDNDKHAVSLSGEPCELTFKEFELLKYLLLNKGIVLSRDKIMDKVWGFEYEGESRTVDMHIKTLRQKLGEAGAYIKTVRNVGYMVE